MPIDDPDAQVPKPVLDAFFRQMKMANDEKVSLAAQSPGRAIAAAARAPHAAAERNLATSLRQSLLAPA